MRIALAHPTYWPEVRRGSERLIHDLASGLAGRGHDVTLLTTHHGRASRSLEEGFTVLRGRRPPGWLPMQRAYEDHLSNAPGVAWRVARGSFDVVHAFFLVDAWAALHARRLGGPPVIFSFHGVPTRPYLVARRYRMEMLRQAVSGAAETIVLSEAAASAMRRYLRHVPRVMPPGVHCRPFAPSGSRAEAPTLLSAAALGDPRKRGELLASAFRVLREQVPDARLVAVTGPDPFMSGRLPALPEGARWLDIHSDRELADAYGRAWVTVLAAPDEAFGITLLESLAAGTPIVAARSGAGPELIEDGRVGCLFESDDLDSLVSAMRAALELAVDSETREACRRRASSFDWARQLPAYEQMYEAVAGR